MPLETDQPSAGLRGRPPLIPLARAAAALAGDVACPATKNMNMRRLMIVGEDDNPKPTGAKNDDHLSDIPS